MAKKFILTDLLIGALFTLMALLFGAVGLRLNLDIGVYYLFLNIAVCCGAISAVCFSIGLIIYLVKKYSFRLPSENRDLAEQIFNSAEKDGVKAIDKIFAKNFLTYAYYVFLSVIGFAFLVGISFCIFVLPLSLVALPFAFITVCPLWRLVECFLKKDRQLALDDGINKEEYEAIYSLFEGFVQKYYGEGYLVKVSFSAPFIMTIEKKGKTINVYLNEYIFFLLNEREIESVFLRHYLQSANLECKKLIRAFYSRDLFTQKAPFGIIFNLYFSAQVWFTDNEFSVIQKSLLRTLEKKSDDLLIGSGFEEDYLRAYKKVSVFDYSFAIFKHKFDYELCKDVNNLRNYVASVYEIFLEIAKNCGDKLEKCIERKLKASICEKLTYSEKSANLGVSVQCGEFVDNTTYEQKNLYDEYNLAFYEGTKAFFEPKTQQIEDFSREIFRYEQEPEKYTERLQLINIAHAYYSLARIDETEVVYKKIIANGDDSAEIHFDYGGFLLVAKSDPSGIEHLYKAMENENFIHDGLELLAKFLVYYGDEKEYLKFCEYKKQRLDEFVKEYKDKRLNKTVNLEQSKINQEILSAILEEIIKDENVEELYCADTKTQSGDKITIFAFSVRNKTNEEAFIQTYERIFSILDNDFSDLDSYLVSIEIEQDKKLVEKIKKDGRFLLFKR